jgi:plastocyanin
VNVNRSIPSADSARATLGAMVIISAIALTGCGGDDDSASAPTAAVEQPTETTHELTEHTTAPQSAEDSGGAYDYVETPTATDAPSGEAGADENEIVISGFAFSGVTEVPVGTTVTIVNEDSGTHTWTATDGTFDSEGLAPGDSFEFTFETAGTFDYRCNLHPSMTGTIVVTP